MNNNIKLNGILKTYLNWPFYLGVFLIAGSGGIFLLDKVSGVLSFMLAMIYLVVAWILYGRTKARYMDELVSFATGYGLVERELMMNLQNPYAILDARGRILWMNKAFMEMSGKTQDYRKNISTIFPQAIPERLPSAGDTLELEVKAESREYNMRIEPLILAETLGPTELVDLNTSEYTLLTLCMTDITELKRYIQLHEDEKIISGLIYIDNFEEAMETVDEVRRSLLNALIERKINRYFNSMDAIVKKLDKDKVFFVMHRKYLEELKEKKFDILQEVKEVNIGNEIAVTLSIGIGMNAQNLSQSADYARVAIELALGRGGDQVVIKNGDELTYYGGKSQHAEKNTRVKARVKAHALKEMMLQRGEILIMGHKLSDADALGAGIGIYCAANSIGHSAHIVLDTITPSIQPLIDSFRKDPQYPSDLFVSSGVARDLISENTMLVVVDTNRPSYTECEDLLSLVKTIVVFDHHRSGGESVKGASLSYIEPYASSTCEMVAEILQYFDDNIHLTNLVADSLYAGIMVDTDNFLSKTGVRTFEAAGYLKRNGADITRIRKLFREKLGDYRARGDAISNAVLFREHYAVSICPWDNVDSPTVVCAQAANALLNIKDVKASFVLTMFKDKVYISARAIDEVNVQVIMERLGGGGHLSIAGTQLADTTIAEARQLLLDTLQLMIDEGDI